jgi:signal transduction histidine kinase
MKKNGIFSHLGKFFFKENPEQLKDFQERQILTIQIAFWANFPFQICALLILLFYNNPDIFSPIAQIIVLIPTYYFLRKGKLKYAKFLTCFPMIFLDAHYILLQLERGLQFTHNYIFIPYMAAILILYKPPFSIIGGLINFILFCALEYYKFQHSTMSNIDFFIDMWVALSVYIIIVLLVLMYKYDFMKLNSQRQIIESQSENLKSLNNAKDRLFSIIAHDLRSPLSSLKGVLQLLDNEFISKEEFKQLSKRLQENVDNVHGMLENLLLWSLSQMEGIKPNLKPFDLNFIIDETIQLFKEVSEQKQIDLNVNTTIHLQAFGDEFQIRTILRNLLNNALKFTPTNGQIRIKSSVKEHSISLKISDTGVGIRKEDLALIFSNPKLNMGTAGEKGTGFGLFLCKELIEKNGGSIEINSEVGKGTIIELSLPIDLSTSNSDLI